jgi:ankyrin repeat protein
MKIKYLLIQLLYFLPFSAIAQRLPDILDKVDIVFTCENLDSLHQLVDRQKLSLYAELHHLYTPLTLSCACGSQYLIDKYKIPLNYECPFSYQPLIIFVVNSRNKKMIDYFTNHGVNIDQSGVHEQSAFYIQSETCQDSVFLQYLIDRGASLTPDEFYTPLHGAISNPNPNIFFFLLHKYLQFDLKESIQDTLLLESAALIGRYDVLSTLMHHRNFRQFAAVTQMQDFHLSTSIDKNSQKHPIKLPLTNSILIKIAEHISTIYQKQPTQEVVTKGQQMLSDLIEKGISVHLINEQGETILFTLSKVPKMVAYLAERKVNLNATNIQGYTALKQIIEELFIQIDEWEGLSENWDTTKVLFMLDRIEDLVAHGAFVNSDQPNSKQYFFFEAVRRNHLKLVETLVQRGYDPNLRDTDGKTALQIATQYGFMELKDFLMTLNKK